MMKTILMVLIVALGAHAQSNKSANTSKTKATKMRQAVSSAPQNTLRIFPLNLLENSTHLSYERNFRDGYAVGFEASQTLGDSKTLLYPDIEFQETYFGPLVQYYFFENFKGFFVEGGLNYARAKIAANAGLNGERVSKEQSYVMPHLTANYRFRAKNGFTATGGLGLFSFLGGEELKIEENHEGYVDGVYTEKKTKVETPYSSNPKLRVRLDVGYTF